jgi:hypothetical protein
VESRISALGTLKSALASLQTAAGNLVPGTRRHSPRSFRVTATAKSGVAATKYNDNTCLALAEQVRKTETALGIPLRYR